MRYNNTNTPATSLEAVDEFEKHLGCSLPSDYRQFLLENNGGNPELDLVCIPDCKSSALVDCFLGLGRQHEDIEDWMNELADDLPDGFIPIGFDPGGNALLMDLADEVVYYWDSARHFPQSSDDDNTYWIANSFSDLLSRLQCSSAAG